MWTASSLSSSSAAAAAAAVSAAAARGSVCREKRTQRRVDPHTPIISQFNACERRRLSSAIVYWRPLASGIAPIDDTVPLARDY